MKVTKVIVKAPKRSHKAGKRKFTIIHDQEITPPRTGDQILAALKQQYEVLSFTIENGMATALVGKKETDEAE